MPSGIYKRIKKRGGWKLSKSTCEKFSKLAKKRGFGKWMKGRKMSEETKLKIKLTKGSIIPKNNFINFALKGEKAYNWKGNNVSYRGLHYWVQRWLGKPSKCEECGLISYGRKIHWANKSGEYKRDLEDWIRMCSKCHGKFDKQNNYRKRKCKITNLNN